MKHLKNVVALLLNDESGQNLIEYALVAGLIGLVAVVAMTSVGTAVKTAFTNIGTSLTNAT